MGLAFIHSSLSVMKLHSDSNIQSIKGEGDLSHVNQAHKKYVAVQDKAANK